MLGANFISDEGVDAIRVNLDSNGPGHIENPINIGLYDI